MEDNINPSISAADILNDGLVLKFDDGRCAFYSCQLLYDTLPWADEMDEADLAW